MGYHTFDIGRADALEDVGRFEYVSVDELLALFDPTPDAVVADLGSGTGFYTDHVAPAVRRLHAVDVQPEMHEFYREKGAPDNVRFVTAEVGDLPFDEGALDGAFSTMTFHEFAPLPDQEGSLAELARVVRPGGLVGIADWSAEGEGRAGPPRTERFDLAGAREVFERSGFTVEWGRERRETFVCRARRTVNDSS